MPSLRVEYPHGNIALRRRPVDSSPASKNTKGRPPRRPLFPMPHALPRQRGCAGQVKICLRRPLRDLKPLSISISIFISNNNNNNWLQHPGNGVLGIVLRVRLIWEPYGSQALCRPYPPNPSPPVFVCTRYFRQVL